MAVTSAAVAVMPLPGLSIAFDVGAVRSESELYFKQLGLDDNSLRYHADMMHADYNQLKAIVDGKCGPDFFSIQGIKTMALLLPEGLQSYYYYTVGH